MKKTILSLLTFFCMAAVNAQFLGINDTEIKQLKQLIKKNTAVKKMYAGFYKDAEAALTEKPNPRDTIVSEGHLNTHPSKIASVFAMKDFNKMYALTIVYKVTNKKKYLTRAINFFTAWATVNHPIGNPINDTKLDRLLAAYDMLRPQLNNNDKATIDAWLIAMADGEIKTAKKGKSTSMNNWHSHRLKVVGQIGYLLDNKTYRAFATNGLLIQIDTNLNKDGTSWDFTERDALHYHAYDLEPLLTLAIIIKRATGADNFNYVSPKGASIKKAVDWFVPYLTGEKTHAEYVNSKQAFDFARAKNNEKGFGIGEKFDPVNGLYTLQLASYFDSNYANTIKLMLKTENDFSDWQLVLNKLMKQS
jgi:hypothetical protein